MEFQPTLFDIKSRAHKADLTLAFGWLRSRSTENCFTNNMDKMHYSTHRLPLSQSSQLPQSSQSPQPPAPVSLGWSVLQARMCEPECKSYCIQLTGAARAALQCTRAQKQSVSFKADVSRILLLQPLLPPSSPSILSYSSLLSPAVVAKCINDRPYRSSTMSNQHPDAPLNFLGFRFENDFWLFL